MSNIQTYTRVLFAMRNLLLAIGAVTDGYERKIMDNKARVTDPTLKLLRIFNAFLSFILFMWEVPAFVYLLWQRWSVITLYEFIIHTANLLLSLYHVFYFSYVMVRKPQPITTENFALIVNIYYFVIHIITFTKLSYVEVQGLYNAELQAVSAVASSIELQLAHRSV